MKLTGSWRKKVYSGWDRKSLKIHTAAQDAWEHCELLGIFLEYLGAVSNHFTTFPETHGTGGELEPSVGG